MTDLQEQSSISGLYRALDKKYGAGTVSRGLAYLQTLPGDDNILPERRYELVTAFCEAYEKERKFGGMAVTDGNEI